MAYLQSIRNNVALQYCCKRHLSEKYISFHFISFLLFLVLLFLFFPTIMGRTGAYEIDICRLWHDDQPYQCGCWSQCQPGSKFLYAAEEAPEIDLKP